VELRLLGPVEAVVDGQVIRLVRRQERFLLAILALEPGRFVPVERLADLLWQEPPPQARGGVAAMVSHLRSALAPARPLGVHIRAGRAGYALEIDPRIMDLYRFRALVERARDAAGGERIRLLDEALRLWRGPALAGAADSWQRAMLCNELDELRVATQEEWLQARLDAGEHRELVDPITRLTGEHPLRERLRGQLMTALYRCGRRPDALKAYRRARQTLVDELGLEPGPELQALHRAILADDPALISAAASGSAPAVPAQLPAAVPRFTGRAEYVKELDALLPRTDSRRPTAIVITAINGTAGVGKTTLAVHWAHRVADRFPDGQLYIDLRGFDPAAPVDPAVAVREFLDALGVPAARIPTSPQAQVGLYRSLLADRRMLILLDNARDSEQVRPLLPGSPGSLVIVTSRDQMTGLVAAQAAHPLTLDVLSVAEAHELLARRLGPERVAAEPEAMARLIARCARLPLALAIVAARAVSRPEFPLEVLADELDDAEAGLDGFGDVRTVFSWSYRTLSRRAAELLRLFGLHAGPDLSAPAAASLAGLPVRQVRPLLAELTRTHLITEHRPGRYTMHDLLRAYAAELAETSDAEPDRRTAVHRVLDHYLHTAHAAATRIEPHREAITLGPAEPGVAAEPILDASRALAWFTTEHAVLIGAVRQAADSGFDTHTWQLAWALTDFLQRRGHWQDQATVHNAGLAAVQRLGDLPGQARSHRHLGRAYALLRRYDDAYAHYRQALDFAVRCGDRWGQAHTHLNLASTLGKQSRNAEALDHAQQALRVFREAGAGAGEARAWNMVGWYRALLGDHAQALLDCRRGLDLTREIGDREGEAYTLDSLGYVYHQLRDLDGAATCYRLAIEIFNALGDRHTEATALSDLAETLHTAGRMAEARAAWRSALTVFDDLGDPAADRIRARLAEVDALPEVLPAGDGVLA
jgi:DNA-binding SARP family transcriptional activator